MTTQFVQIGNRAFNPAHVCEISFNPENRIIRLCGSSGGELAWRMQFKGNDYDAFMSWWEYLHGARVWNKPIATEPEPVPF